ncbi:hypothetical protein NV379_04775 [Paenibacillus sp. N1-5-1-14]|uniref:hypothetical protein n=1 Tax=Paenibacillus radicibacter TaxID=2972488 RepID=UPI0021597297|nr:hypothetical protein [Paenibacillus radicibacter]MCR8641963.1 hypothetical protein [Paenibacillus radicibacter]
MLGEGDQMDADKRKTIMNEITHWRRSKLLPEQYCDFLMNLYRDEHTGQAYPKPSGKAAVISNSHWRYWLYAVLGLGLLGFSLFHFASMSLILQMGISCVFVLGCYMMGLGRKKNSPFVSTMLCLAASLILLVSGMYVISKTTYNEPTYYVEFIACCAMIWLIIGLTSKQYILHLFGWLALIFVYAWFINAKLDHVNIAYLQLGWVGLVGLFTWLGWLTHHRSKEHAKVLFIVGAVCWFVPEVMNLVTGHGGTLEFVQMLLFGKLAVGALLLFVLRKKWTEWVV